jgi:hypothetical protein
MRELRFTRDRHRSVATALGLLDAEFLGAAACCFAGGTRVVLELGEYRESEDMDFLCADRDGYRALRMEVSQWSLGRITKAPVRLLREVRSDRYGIRTMLDLDGQPMKFEIVFEGRIPLGLEHVGGTDVPCLDRPSCIAEKFLANADRGGDDAYWGRDVIDLAFMIDAWGIEIAKHGLEVARGAYGDVVVRAAGEAAGRLQGDAKWQQKCLERLSMKPSGRLTAGLRALAMPMR